MSSGVHQHADAAADPEVECSEGRGQGPVSPARVPVQRGHRPAVRLPALLRARLPEMRLPRRADSQSKYCKYPDLWNTHAARVLARISKMPVQNSNFKISARADLATKRLQIFIPTTLNSLLCRKSQINLQPSPERWFTRKKTFGLLSPKIQNRKFFIKKFACPKRRFSGNYLSKRQAGRVLAKSLNMPTIRLQH